MTTTQLGGYGCYTLKASVLDDVRDYLGDFVDDFDLPGLTDAYRAQINAELEGTGISLIGNDFYGAIEKMPEIAYDLIYDDDGVTCPIRRAIQRADLGALIGSFGKAC